ncbi:MAG: glycosyltransferase, partial [Planctomycetia bacterium]
MTTNHPPSGAAIDGRPELSVVLPLYNEEEVFPELRLRLTAVLEEIGRAGRSWEVVLVDDGSRDRTNELAAAWCDAEDRIRLVELSRNFGHAAACTAGLEAAGGRAAVLMDGDLQDPPELIPLLIA